MDITTIVNNEVDSLSKSIPAGESVDPASVAEKGWSLLQDDLHYPVLVLKDGALDHNIKTMARWCGDNGFLHAPHGKTTMCPQIYQRQLGAGAWGITVATVSQAMVCIRFGVKRILMANQLVGKANVQSIVAETTRDPELEFYCLIDSVTGVKHLAGHLKNAGTARPIRVFLEWGRPGWRTGVRTVDEARTVCEALQGYPELLELCGFEGHEGSAKVGPGEEPEVAQVTNFLGGLLKLEKEMGIPGDTGEQPLLFSIGGTSYLDMVRDALVEARECYRCIVRSGCYVTHDHGFYASKVDQARERAARPKSVPRFQPALELWSQVQSVQDGQTAILTFGKRDCPYDMDLPIPLFSIPERKDLKDRQALDKGRITHINDQHAFLSFPEGTGLSVGDRVVCGISHPCTAFDKWRVIPLVDDDYRVLNLYRTYF